MNKYEEPQRCSPQWEDRKLDAIAFYLARIAESLERLADKAEGLQRKEPDKCV